MAHSTINPIIPGFAPDPSLVLVDGTFFLVNSTFHMFPGIPVYASKDLVNWEHIGNAINRQSQLKLRLSDVIVVPPGPSGDYVVCAGGLYAPSIRHHNGTFYIICTNIIHEPGAPDETRANFIVSCQDPFADEWSDPVPLEFNGIDPSLFFDDDGRSYFQGAKAPGPMTRIFQFEVDIKTGAKLSKERNIWDGTGGAWAEGPHLYKRDGWYYLLISEGGCWEEHMITAARSKSVWGPFESYANNPILTARGDSESIQHTGHSDVIEDGQGSIWAVCLAVRRDADKRYNMGRETFLTTGDWPKGEWPILDRVKPNPKGLDVAIRQSIVSRPLKDFLYIRDADLSKHQIKNEGKQIILTPNNVPMAHRYDSPIFVGKRQREINGKAQVTIQAGSQPWEDSTKAGLSCYKDEHRYFNIFFDASEQSVVFEAVNTTMKLDPPSKYKLKLEKSLKLQIEYTEKEYRFSYLDGAGGSNEWKLAGTLDTLLSTNKDFTGPVIGVFAFSKGKAADIQFDDLTVE